MCDESASSKTPSTLASVPMQIAPFCFDTKICWKMQKRVGAKITKSPILLSRVGQYRSTPIISGHRLKHISHSENQVQLSFPLYNSTCYNDGELGDRYHDYGIWFGKNDVNGVSLSLESFKESCINLDIFSSSDMFGFKSTWHSLFI